MTKIHFSFKAGRPVSFFMEGHAGAGFLGSDIVCAALSSAAYMAANTITDVMGVQAEAAVADARFSLILPDDAPREAIQVMEGLQLHFEQLESQYPTSIQLENSEV